MALVRRAAVGRAQVPGAVLAPSGPPVSAVPAGPSAAPVSPPVSVQPGYDMAAAVPSKPAHPWAVLLGLGSAVAGGAGAWNVNQMMAPSVFEVGNDLSTFLALFVFATAVERILEPITRWMPGRREQERYEKAVADMDNGVPGATNAAAVYKAAVDRARAARGVIMWGLATGLSTILASTAGFCLLRMIASNSSWNGVPVWVDALITGLVVGSGTKPVHDLINRVQKQSNVTQTPI
jgi:hypothetical protein